MVDKIGSKRTAERMDRWVDLHTNNKSLYSSLMFTIGRCFQLLTVLVFGCPMNFLCFFSLSLFCLVCHFGCFSFFGRARGRGLSSPTQSLTNLIFITPSFETNHYNINTSFFRRIELGRRERGGGEEKVISVVGGLKLYVEQRVGVVGVQLLLLL